MINIEIVTLNIVQYARAANPQTLQKLTDGSFPSQSKPQCLNTDSCEIDTLTPIAVQSKLQSR